MLRLSLNQSPAILQIWCQKWDLLGKTAEKRTCQTDSLKSECGVPRRRESSSLADRVHLRGIARRAACAKVLQASEEASKSCFGKARIGWKCLKSSFTLATGCVEPTKEDLRQPASTRSALFAEEDSERTGSFFFCIFIPITYNISKNVTTKLSTIIFYYWKIFTIYKQRVTTNTECRGKKSRTRNLITGVQVQCTTQDPNQTSVHSWIQEFEDNAAAVQWNSLQMFIYSMQLLKGAAKIFVRSHPGISNWWTLKRALETEFGSEVSAIEVHRMLKNRWKGPNEDYNEYLYSLMEIGKPDNLDDPSLIEYFIEGIPDSRADKSNLYHTYTIPYLYIERANKGISEN